MEAGAQESIPPRPSYKTLIELLASPTTQTEIQQAKLSLQKTPVHAEIIKQDDALTIPNIHISLTEGGGFLQLYQFKAKTRTCLQKLLCQTPERVDIKLKTEFISVIHCGAKTKNHQIILERHKISATDEFLWQFISIIVKSTSRIDLWIKEWDEVVRLLKALSIKV